MDDADRRPRAWTLLRIGLALFVAAWIFGPYALRAAVPVWVPFAIALVLALEFLTGAFRPAPWRPPDRGPQPVDRERYGYPDPAEDLPPPDGEDGEVVEPDAEDEAAATEADEPAPHPRSWQARRLLVGATVVAALVLVLWAVESRSGWNGLDAGARAEAVARLSDEASRIAEKPVRIECDEAGEHVGVVQHADGAAVVGGDVAYLTPTRCLDLYRLAFEGEARSAETGRAIAVLAHEAWHLHGVRDEGTTECYALQSGVDLGRRLGLSEETARRMMRQQLAENARRGPASFEYRVPPDCRAGGRLDLDPATARFP